MRYATVFTILAAWPAMLLAQAPATQPAHAVPSATRPTRVDQRFQARVIKLVGNVQYAAVNAEGAPGEWHPVQLGDTLPGGTWIRTMLRSRLVLAFGDDTVVLIDRVTLASIDQFYRSADTKRIRLGLGFGAVRGGVAETTLRSDMAIATPTAVLSKRGTIDFGIEYDAGTDHFRVYLAREGLVEVLNRLSGQSRYVRPGQYVTQAMLRWIETAKFDRYVPVADVFGLTHADKLFNAYTEPGLDVVEPGGGSTIHHLAGRDASALFAQIAAQRQGALQAAFLPPFIPVEGVINRPEGNFGTGSGLFKALRK